MILFKLRPELNQGVHCGFQLLDNVVPLDPINVVWFRCESGVVTDEVEPLQLLIDQEVLVHLPFMFVRQSTHPNRAYMGLGAWAFYFDRTDVVGS